MFMCWHDDQNRTCRVDAMVAALAPALQERFGIQAPPSIVELDSSTDTKFSRHLIVHNVVFRDTRHCGAFVKYFAEVGTSHSVCARKVGTCNSRGAMCTGAAARRHLPVC
jgi:hypothetical protein